MLNKTLITEKMSIYQMKTINLSNQNWFSSSDKIFDNQKNCVAKCHFVYLINWKVKFKTLIDELILTIYYIENKKEWNSFSMFNLFGKLEFSFAVRFWFLNSMTVKRKIGIQCSNNSKDNKT